MVRWGFKIRVEFASWTRSKQFPIRGVFSKKLGQHHGNIASGAFSSFSIFYLISLKKKPKLLFFGQTSMSHPSRRTTMMMTWTWCHQVAPPPSPWPPQARAQIPATPVPTLFRPLPADVLKSSPKKRPTHPLRTPIGRLDCRMRAQTLFRLSSFTLHVNGLNINVLFFNFYFYIQW